MSAKDVTVPAGLHRQARFFAATRGFWQALAGIETAAVRDELDAVPVIRPIYVSGLARSGTTILTELLERHPVLTSHHYSDFPNVWTPYWRNYLLQKTRRRAPEPEERAHRDRIMVSQDSPEAVEEVLWMHFFPGCHEPGRDNTLGADTSHPAFETFYRDHVRKLLAVRGAQRYLAKGNYHVMRFAYLQRLFPDMKLLVPYRKPVDHIASLAKQHRFFLQQHEQDPRVGRHLSLSGHFEFGPYRQAVHFGDEASWNAIAQAWSEGREIEGWARYWAATYRHVLHLLTSTEGLAANCRLVSYERLCNESGPVIDALLAHCELDSEPFQAIRAHYLQHLSPPGYYRPEFSHRERALIEDICHPVLAELERHPANA